MNDYAKNFKQRQFIIYIYIIDRNDTTKMVV